MSRTACITNIFAFVLMMLLTCLGAAGHFSVLHFFCKLYKTVSASNIVLSVTVRKALKKKRRLKIQLYFWQENEH